VHLRDPHLVCFSTATYLRTIINISIDLLLAVFKITARYGEFLTKRVSIDSMLQKNYNYSEFMWATIEGKHGKKW